MYIWRYIGLLTLVIAIVVLIVAFWVAKITHNTVEYTEHLYERTDALIRDELKTQFEIYEKGNSYRDNMD